VPANERSRNDHPFVLGVRRRRHRVFLLVAVLAMLGSWFVLPGPAHGQSYGGCQATVSSTDVSAGQTITVTGSGAVADGTVTASIDGSEVGSGTADGAGNFSFAATIPDTASGSETLSVDCGGGAVEDITLTVAAPPQRFLPAGTATATYTCVGADTLTQNVLNSIGLSSFDVGAKITSDPVASPDPGDPLTMTFLWQFTLPASLVSISFDLGNTELPLSNGVDPMIATTGATGSVIGNAAPHTVSLGNGTSAVTYTEGPFTGTVTRTAAIGDPIVFTPGTTTNSVTIPGLTLNFTCDPGDITPMTLTDQEGPVPPTTTTSTTVVATTTTPAVAGNALPRTGGVDGRLIILGLGLIGVGCLTWTAARLGRGRAAR